MKNDIDSILNSMFRDGRLNFRSSEGAKPAPPPEKAAPQAPVFPKPPEAPSRDGAREALARRLADATAGRAALQEAGRGWYPFPLEDPPAGLLEPR